MSGEREPAPVLSPPRRSLDYDDLRVESVLGRGGQAVVRRARVVDDRPPEYVALKEPLETDTLTRATVEAFLDEAETWATVDAREREDPRWADSEFVGGVVDTGEELPWIAIEYMDGGSLADRLADAPGGLPVEEALWLGECVCRGVAVAHAYGIAHLDLKPANVLFRSTDEAWDHPKVADWGLARALADRTGGTDGLSVGYAAPEQFDPDAFGDPDTLTDIYQLGALVYALLTGAPPADGSPFEVAQATVDGSAPAPPSELRPELPAAVDAAVLVALAPEKTDRYSAVTEFRDALRAVRTDRRLPAVVADRLEADSRTAAEAGETTAETAERGDRAETTETAETAGRAETTETADAVDTGEAVSPSSGGSESEDPDRTASEREARQEAPPLDPPTGDLVDRLAGPHEDHHTAGFALIERAAAHPETVLPHVGDLLALCENDAPSAWAAAAAVGNAIERRPAAVNDHIDRLLALLRTEADAVREPIADALTTTAEEAASVPLLDLADRLPECSEAEAAAAISVLAVAATDTEGIFPIGTFRDLTDAEAATVRAGARYVLTLCGDEGQPGVPEPTRDGFTSLANAVHATALDEFLQQTLLRTAIDEFLADALAEAGYAGMDLALTPEGTQLLIRAAEPGLVVGKGGENVERIATELERRFSVEDIEIAVDEPAEEP